MIAVIQRVKESSVYIDNEKYSEIKSGLNVLLCVTQDDSESDVYYLADKIVKLRIFADEQDKMNLSLLDLNKELLVISQFTLAADTKKGNRPSFTNAAEPEKGNRLYQLFVSYIKEKYDINPKTGVFAANMQVHIVNDGPVTVIIDSTQHRK
ncbi:MAG TPA: D-aminoacyl-tRNA deacylase [Clostridia bacterium]|jgi:D-tyrosyl-tRNA(Tyr) deacylase|nr:D-tyrosyl-tRNA(Tyr) deacylase [Clostridiaceae bacterium]HOF25843.1 D-aminoacyl-tRNA deacylase [Clostridia bacterium]HOM33714.1 D-aminoacyl-tRNA deacylase [Clostridia bacterium]HOR88868.1 D-aminoacyl-tRNA deacylase [Clostridia bacterium]HOT71099.1 D-aminoacyl-tRNA deacylase [Clostridia bacterium]